MTIWTPNLDRDAKSKYQAIADAIGREIASGTLKPGQQLPTQRDLSKRLSVTIGTIGRAYALAEKQGLISLEVGRGSFVRSFEARPESPGQQPDVIDLGLNLPPATEHSDLLARTLAKISHSRDIGTLFGCAPVDSFPRYRAAASNWLSARIKCTEEEVLICSGTQNALISSLTTLTQPGDSVLVEALTFPGFIAAASLLHLNLIPVGMDEHGIIPMELDRAARSSKVLYCVPTNQNPTTATMPTSRRREVARIAAKRNLTIIEDDVYGKLLEDAPDPLATFAPDRTFYVASLAKTLSVGLRLAYVCVPSEHRDSMVSNLRASNFFPASLLCDIAADWIEGDTANRLLHEQRQTAIRRQEIAREVFDNHLIQGNPTGHHLWLKLPDVWSAETLERAARENGVSLYPAATFARPDWPTPNAVRIALGAARNDNELRRGLNVIARLLNERSDHSPTRY